MDAIAARQIDAGTGTPEAPWRDWIDACNLPCVQPADLVHAGQRAVVVAPHPDDEVLMAGGLLAELAALGERGQHGDDGHHGNQHSQVRHAAVIAVTDGEASHPGSVLRPRDRLSRQRADETALALAHLGCRAPVLRLALPDGHVAEHLHTLIASLKRLLRPSDVVFTTWTLDGHPDHEATGRATREAAAAVGARLYEVPVWGWHWARPGEPAMPWRSAVRVSLSASAVQRKCDAVLAYASQWERDEACADTPILRPTILQRAQRPYEVVFG